MPSLSPTMTAGKIVEWNFKKGDIIKSGDVLFTVETDKAVMEFEVPYEGIIGDIIVGNNTNNVKVGTVVGWILENENDTIPTSSEVRTETNENNMQNHDKDQQNINLDKKQDTPVSNGKNYYSTPAARARAKLMNFDIKEIIDSVDHKIRDIDVLNFAQRQRSVQLTNDEAQQTISKTPNKSIHETNQPKSEINAESPIFIREDEEEIQYELDAAQKLIASGTARTKSTVPHFYIDTDCCIDNLEQARQKLKEIASRTTITHWVIKAAALALQKYPFMNARFKDDIIHQRKSSDIGIIIASNNGTSHIPTIEKAHCKSVNTIAQEVRSLSALVNDFDKKSKDGEEIPDDMKRLFDPSRSSFTISSIGMYGIDRCLSILNAPQVGVMAIGRARKSPYLKEDTTFAEKTVINVSLSVDHRVLNGRYACQFLKCFKDMIENPMTMI